MANPHRAEIDLDVLGQKFKLRLDVDAICNAEAELDMGFGDLISRVLGRGASMRLARAVICAASSGAIDRDKANAMLEFDNLVVVWPQVVRLVALCLPPAAEDGEANPPVAGSGALGTGTES